MPLFRQVESKTKIRVPNYHSLVVYQLTEARWWWGGVAHAVCVLNTEVFALEVHILTSSKRQNSISKNLPDFIHLFIIFNLYTKVGANIYYHLTNTVHRESMSWCAFFYNTCINQPVFLPYMALYIYFVANSVIILRQTSCSSFLLDKSNEVEKFEDFFKQGIDP